MSARRRKKRPARRDEASVRSPRPDGQVGEVECPSDAAVASERLRHLYDISKILTKFDSVERTVPLVLALVSETVPLQIAILMLEEAGARSRTRATTWHAKGVSAAHL